MSSKKKDRKVTLRFIRITDSFYVAVPKSAVNAIVKSKDVVRAHCSPTNMKRMDKLYDYMLESNTHAVRLNAKLWKEIKGRRVSIPTKSCLRLNGSHTLMHHIDACICAKTCVLPYTDKHEMVQHVDQFSYHGDDDEHPLDRHNNDGGDVIVDFDDRNYGTAAVMYLTATASLMSLSMGGGYEMWNGVDPGDILSTPAAISKFFSVPVTTISNVCRTVWYGTHPGLISVIGEKLTTDAADPSLAKYTDVLKLNPRDYLNLIAGKLPSDKEDLVELGLTYHLNHVVGSLTREQRSAFDTTVDLMTSTAMDSAMESNTVLRVDKLLQDQEARPLRMMNILCSLVWSGMALSFKKVIALVMYAGDYAARALSACIPADIVAGGREMVASWLNAFYPFVDGVVLDTVKSSYRSLRDSGLKWLDGMGISAKKGTDAISKVIDFNSDAHANGYVGQVISRLGLAISMFLSSSVVVVFMIGMRVVNAYKKNQVLNAKPLRTYRQVVAKTVLNLAFALNFCWMGLMGVLEILFALSVIDNRSDYSEVTGNMDYRVMYTYAMINSVASYAILDEFELADTYMVQCMLQVHISLSVALMGFGNMVDGSLDLLDLGKGALLPTSLMLAKPIVKAGRSVLECVGNLSSSLAHSTANLVLPETIIDYYNKVYALEKKKLSGYDSDDDLNPLVERMGAIQI